VIIVGAGTLSGDWQVEFNGLLMGTGTPYELAALGGFLDMPAVRSQHNPRPGRDGMFVGPDYAAGKVYDLELEIAAEGGTSFAAAVLALEQAAQPQGQTLIPLRFQLPGKGVRAAWVQCLRRAIPVDLGFEKGFVQKSLLQFWAPDGRQYGPGLVVQAGLRTQGGGLTYPLTYPLTYGTPGSGGRVTFTNSGTAATEPVITVSGPLTAGFEITHAETGRRLRYTAAVGSDIVLDCGEGTCTSQGQERAMFLTIREWFSVAAGATATFALATLGGETAASSPTVGMTVQLASAYT